MNVQPVRRTSGLVSIGVVYGAAGTSPPCALEEDPR